jgi:hypothetical protein
MAIVGDLVNETLDEPAENEHVQYRTKLSVVLEGYVPDEGYSASPTLWTIELITNPPTPPSIIVTPPSTKTSQVGDSASLVILSSGLFALDHIDQLIGASVDVGLSGVLNLVLLVGDSSSLSILNSGSFALDHVSQVCYGQLGMGLSGSLVDAIVFVDVSNNGELLGISRHTRNMDTYDLFTFLDVNKAVSRTTFGNYFFCVIPSPEETDVSINNSAESVFGSYDIVVFSLPIVDESIHNPVESVFGSYNTVVVNYGEIEESLVNASETTVDGLYKVVAITTNRTEVATSAFSRSTFGSYNSI